jgi:hypothetical protein
MFRRSNKVSQPKLFTSTQHLLSGRSLKVYEDNNKWHNQFRIQVTQRIDEELFRHLYCEDFGSPNSSIRILIGMMILKEARGWSDSELFEECRFNLLVRSSLGMLNIDDSTPAESTYYLLRKHIVDWEKSGHENLIETVFAQVTKSQVIEFKINGSKVRMDSKLMGSNLAWYSRYELIHETVRKAYGSLKASIDRFLDESEIEYLECILGESGDKVSYRSNKSEIETKLVQLGRIIFKIIQQMDNSPESISTLGRVFNEQYQIVDGTVSARPKQEISAQSVQSPHDTDCHYRKKDDNQVKGYSINVTETCDEAVHQEIDEVNTTAGMKDAESVKPLNLITHVSVDVASAADCDFLQPSIEATQQVITQKIETVNADGAYHSVDNQDYCQENSIDLIIGAIQGQPSRYDISQDENGSVTVTDLTTNTKVEVRQVEPRKKGSEPKWAIKTENNKHRYFTKKEIDTCLLRKQIANRPQSELNRRNNVEASIFQLGYHYSNDKSRYRGLIKHKMWANARCLWINFVRISNFIAVGGSKCVQTTKNSCIFSCFWGINEKKWFTMSDFFLFLINPIKTINIVSVCVLKVKSRKMTFHSGLNCTI